MLLDAPDHMEKPGTWLTTPFLLKQFTKKTCLIAVLYSKLNHKSFERNSFEAK